MPEDTAVQHVQQTCEAVFWLKLVDIIFTIQGKRICRNWFFRAAQAFSSRSVLETSRSFDAFDD